MLPETSLSKAGAKVRHFSDVTKHFQENFFRGKLSSKTFGEMKEYNYLCKVKYTHF